MPSYLLRENGGRLGLENGLGFLLLEISEPIPEADFVITLRILAGGLSQWAGPGGGATGARPSMRIARGDIARVIVDWKGFLGAGGAIASSVWETRSSGVTAPAIVGRTAQALVTGAGIDDVITNTITTAAGERHVMQIVAYARLLG